MPRLKLSRHEKLRLLERQGHACAHCAASLFNDVFDIDHVVPHALQPTNKLEALQALCPTCHARKSRAEYKNIQQFKEMRKRGSARLCWQCHCVVSKYFWDGLRCRACVVKKCHPAALFTAPK